MTEPQSIEDSASGVRDPVEELAAEFVDRHREGEQSPRLPSSEFDEDSLQTEAERCLRRGAGRRDWWTPAPSDLLGVRTRPCLSLNPEAAGPPRHPPAARAGGTYM